MACEVPMADVDDVLTAEEAAELLKVSSKTILRLARDGDLPGLKVGRAWRFCRSELLGVLAQPSDAKASR